MDFNRLESAHNFAILDDTLKQNFVDAVNKLMKRNYKLQPPLEGHRETPYGEWLGFPAHHPFYTDIYTYLKKNNPALLAQSNDAEDDGVTNSAVAFYMIEQSQKPEKVQKKKETVKETKKAVAGEKVVEQTAQSLSGLKKLLAEKIVDDEKEKKVIEEIEDMERKKSSMIDSPASFALSRKEITDVLNLLPPEVAPEGEFVERMLNYILIGELLRHGVIPYIDANGTVKVDFEASAGENLKKNWQGINTSWADHIISSDVLKGFMAYTSVGQSPTSQIDIAKSLFAPGVVDNMAGQKVFNAQNVLSHRGIAPQNKSLILSYLAQGQQNPIDVASVSQASNDAQQFARAGVADTLAMTINSVTRYDRERVKWKLPSSTKEWADFIRHPIGEAGKRFGGAGAILAIITLGYMAWKIPEKVLGDHGHGWDEKGGHHEVHLHWFKRTVGVIGALAAMSIGGNVMGDLVENSVLERVNPDQSEKDRSIAMRGFEKTVPDFQKDVFPSYFSLWSNLKPGKDSNEKPFWERVDAREFFQDFSYHPNDIDTLGEITIGNNEKIKWATLAAYKTIYREVYYRRKDIARARAAESDPTRKEAIFPSASIEPGAHETLQAYLAKFYGNNIDKIPDEKRFNIFAPKLAEMKMKFVDEPAKIENIPKQFERTSLLPLTWITHTPGKNTAELDLPRQNKKFILPSWDMDGDLQYDYVEENGRFLIKIVDKKNLPPEWHACYCILSKVGAWNTYQTSEMVMDGAYYKR